MAVARNEGRVGVRTRPARLSAADLLNLAIEARDTPINIGALAILDGRTFCDAGGQLRLAEIRVQIDRSLADVPQLHWILHHPGPLAGRPVWIDDPMFRIDRHVLEAELPPPGDEQALLRLTENLMTSMLDRSHPLWQMWFVPGLPAGRVAVIIKLHHVMADGSAAVRLVTSLVDPPAGAGPAPSRPWTAAAAPRWRELVRDNARAKLAALRQFARLSSPQRLVGAIRAHWRILATAWRAPRTSLNAPIGPRRRLAVLRIDLATAKRVAHWHGGKVNDVVLSLAAGGLRALLRSRAEPVDGLWLHTAIAASLRTAGQTAEAGNHTGGFVVRLPLGEPDPGSRLKLVSAESARAKRDQLATAGNALLVWLARLGLARRVSRRQHMTNLVESNVIGPPSPIHLLGAPTLELIPIGNLAGNIGVSFLALSYAGRLTITVLADADRYSDLPVLLAAMERDWTTLTATDVYPVPEPSA